MKDSRDRGFQDSSKMLKNYNWKQTLGPLNPGALEPFLPTNWEKNHMH